MCMNYHSASLSNDAITLIKRISRNSCSSWRLWHHSVQSWFDLLLTNYCCWTNKPLTVLWFVIHYKLFSVKHLQEVRKYSCGYVELVKRFQKPSKAHYQYSVSNQFPVSFKLYHVCLRWQRNTFSFSIMVKSLSVEDVCPLSQTLYLCNIFAM